MKKVIKIEDSNKNCIKLYKKGVCVVFYGINIVVK